LDTAKYAPPHFSGQSQRDEPRRAYRDALGRYKGTSLAAIRRAQGLAPFGAALRPAADADEITDYLDLPGVVDSLVARLTTGSRLALSYFALSDTSAASRAGLNRALGILGAEPDASIMKLLELGLLVISPRADAPAVGDFADGLKRADPERLYLRAHPAVAKAVPTARADVAPPRPAGQVTQVRESDGLEPILRLAAVWQRVGAEPLRQTQHGTLYKRDRDRIADDPVLGSPIADAMKPLPRLPELWLGLASHVGLIESEPMGERILAAAPEYWDENAIHLPQMIAGVWMGLREWDELGAKPRADGAASALFPYLRFALLLWLSMLAESEWASLIDMADQLSERLPGWDELSTEAESRPSATEIRKNGARNGRARTRLAAEPALRAPTVLESILLGAAYPLGLIRAAEARATGRLVVQLTPLGRYVLALGPAPSPRETFEQFLFVQPNFEVIAYRQGLTPQLVGCLSRFARWSQIGSALELKLTRDSVVQGLDGGFSPNAVLETLTRHSQRELPHGITDAVRNWASRRERVTYYAGVTLIEFGSSSERDTALAIWPAPDQSRPIAVAERFLLVEDEKTVPFDRLRSISSRDYRRPPEICVATEPDGVTLVLDPARSDLLVEAELGRFADLLPAAHSERELTAQPQLRRFRVTPASLRRGMARGMSPAGVLEWYMRRTGGQVSPAVRLLMAARTAGALAFDAARIVVVNLPTAELLDGLFQHPATGRLLGERLGPTAAAIVEGHVALLKESLRELGIDLNFE
jgi:hypothetical protein